MASVTHCNSSWQSYATAEKCRHQRLPFHEPDVQREFSLSVQWAAFRWLESPGTNWLSSFDKSWTNFTKNLSTMVIPSGSRPSADASKRTCQRCRKRRHALSYSRSSSSSSCCHASNCEAKLRSRLLHQLSPSLTKLWSISVAMLPFSDSVSLRLSTTPSPMLNGFSRTSSGDCHGWASAPWITCSLRQRLCKEKRCRRSFGDRTLARPWGSGDDFWPGLLPQTKVRRHCTQPVQATHASTWWALAQDNGHSC